MAVGQVDPQSLLGGFVQLVFGLLGLALANADGGQLFVLAFGELVQLGEGVDSRSQYEDDRLGVLGIFVELLVIELGGLDVHFSDSFCDVPSGCLQHSIGPDHLQQDHLLQLVALFLPLAGQLVDFGLRAHVPTLPLLVVMHEGADDPVELDDLL